MSYGMPRGSADRKLHMKTDDDLLTPTVDMHFDYDNVIVLPIAGDVDDYVTTATHATGRRQWLMAAPRLHNCLKMMTSRMRCGGNAGSP